MFYQPVEKLYLVVDISIFISIDIYNETIFFQQNHSDFKKIFGKIL